MECQLFTDEFKAGFASLWSIGQYFVIALTGYYKQVPTERLLLNLC